MTDKPPIDFKAVHKRAAEMVETDTVLAYAIAKELRKRVVGRDSEQVKFELLSQLAYATWNDLIDIQQRGGDRPESIKTMLEIFSEALIFGYDILTDKVTYATPPSRPGK